MSPLKDSKLSRNYPLDILYILLIIYIDYAVSRRGGRVV